ncbi:hypothetical protein [Frondihabitans sp. PAMC 28766]|uniref:hypothetical protein n=1 Tax=Frondihabitans sp. PAMC 28766 TaxID=1795630 RepID=UPI0012FF86AA|nr:hypothetical protein [Frondihabitans sp. PAMC 28766]
MALFLSNAPPKAEKTRVLLLSTATDFLAVGAGVGSAILLSLLLHGVAPWLLAPFVAGVLYVLVQALEISVARSQDSDDDD